MKENNKYQAKYCHYLSCLIVCLIILFFGKSLQADAYEWDDMGFESQHISTFYDINAGLPFSEMNAVAQTQEGFMYLGGYGGLAQYDGKKFNLIEEITSVVSLYAAKDGNLWIGTNDKGIVCMTPESEFIYYGKEAGLRSLAIRDIIKDDYDNLIFATGEGIYRMDTTGKLISIDDERIRESYISILTKDSKGVMYGATYNGALFSMRDDEIIQYYSAEELGVDIRSISEDSEQAGMVYLGTEESYILHGVFGEPLSTYEIIETPGLTGINKVKLVDGRLWICANNGIGYIDEDHGFQRLRFSNINSVGNMMADYEGNLWFTSTRNGVMKISDSIFMDVSLMSDTEGLTVNTTWMKDNLLYIGTDTGLLLIDSDGNHITTPIVEQLSTARIRAIKEDRQGNLWFCTFSENGLVCLKPDGEIVSYTENNGLLTNYARTIYECSDGRLIVSVTKGLHFIENGKITRTIVTRNYGIPNDIVLSICEGLDGRIYLGIDGNGIYVLDGEEIIPFDGESDMESGIILGLKRDDVRNLIWIITSNSVGYMKDGKITTLNNIPTGKRTSGCYDLLLPKGDDIWVCGGTGIYIINASQLLAGENPDYTFYNGSMGLPHITTSNSRNYVAPNGDAFLSGIDGVTKVNIEDKQKKSVSPKIALPYIDVDDERIYLDEEKTVRIPSHVKRITIYQYVLSFGLTDPKVSYYLEGFDKKPVETSKQELSQVSYTNLPGGNYQFHLTMMDKNNDRSADASFTLVKEKALYEQPLFWILLIIGIILLTAYIIIWYFRGKVRKLEKKKEEERIAEELNMATSIQAGALPSIFPAFPDRKEFDIYASMTPAKEVGGDFYDFFMVDDNHLGMVIADVSDKGIPAALFMMSSKMIISSHAKMGKFPSEVLEAANNGLTANNMEDMFVTVWLGILDLEKGVLTAANAGHEYPIFMQAGSSFEIVKDKHGFVLGTMPDMFYMEYELRLKPGAKLFVYTDGVPEASNAEKEFYGLERTVETLNKYKDCSSKEILEHMKESVSEFVGDAPQFDDLTMMCLHYIGSSQTKEKE